MGLPPLTADWEDEIASAAIPFMSAEIVIFTGLPISGANILFQGKSRVQQVRQPRGVSTTYEWSAQRIFRFQIDYSEVATVNITKGNFIRVLSGGRDATLYHLPFEVLSAVNSDHRAVRTIEATTSGAILPVVTL